MNEQQWLVCEDPRAMMDLLRAKGLETDEKWWHYVWACRARSGIDLDQWKAQDLVHVLNTWFEGDVYEITVPLAYRCALIREIWGNPFRRVRKVEQLPKGYCLILRESDGCVITADADRLPVKFPRYNPIGSNEPDPPDEIGIVLEPTPWLFDEPVIAMARLIHNTQDWGLMPIYADLLEDAGCDNEDVLRHARGEERCYGCSFGESEFYPGGGGWCALCNQEGPRINWIPARAPHVRGCWLLDLILSGES